MYFYFKKIKLDDIQQVIKFSQNFVILSYAKYFLLSGS